MSLTTFILVAISIPLSMILLMLLFKFAIERGGVYKRALFVILVALAVVSMVGNAAEVWRLLGGAEPTGVTGAFGVWLGFAVSWLYFPCVVWLAARRGFELPAPE